MTMTPDELWADILSREATLVLEAWETLTAEEQQAVRAHLERMATEEGWTQPQRLSALAALRILDSLSL